MIRHHLHWYLAVVVLLCGGSLLARGQEIPNPFPPGDVATAVLPNGVRVLVREDHSLPIVSMVVAVRGGSSAESNTRGLAHYLEHLAFQGTKRYPGALAPQYALERVGGISNAVTTRDAIRFQAVGASAQVELMMEVLADVVLAPTLSTESFAAERPVILAEIQHEADSPTATAINRAYALSYQKHPYRNSPKGTIEEILALTADNARAFHQRWFVPGNMSVILVGDITLKRAAQLAQKAFGAAKPAKTPPWPAPETATPQGVTDHIDRENPDTYQVMAFAAPASGDAAAVVSLDVLLTLLGDGNDALLPAWWAKNGVRVTSFGTEYATSRDPGRLLIWAQTAPDMADRLRTSTLALLQRLAAGDIPEDLLRLARQRLAGQFLRDNETYSQQAATLAFYESLGNTALVSRYVPQILATTRTQVQAVTPTRPVAWVTLGARPEGGR